MSLPAELLEAVSVPGGGKVTLVVGAGCSLEPPTLIPLAPQCSQECHDRLVANGVLDIGDCLEPKNLSSLADAVFAKTGEQRLLVQQLQHYQLKTATPNEGHLLAAALLREGAIASVLTLNFDLALTTAISELGAGRYVGIIDRPEDIANQKTVNLYYLHRNANVTDTESWILRTEALSNDWKNNWESVVTAKVLTTPVVVFVGLGSPADVLVESTKLIQKAIPSGITTYQVDPRDCEESEFFKTLALDRSAYIQATWGDFMADLSQRLLVAHVNQLEAAADTIVARENLASEDITALLQRLLDIGLHKVGLLRARWLLHDTSYHAEQAQDRERVADLILAAALIGRVTNTIPILFDDGIVEFRQDGRTVATHIFVSGGGTRSRSAIESELSVRKRLYRGRSYHPAGAIIAGTSDGGGAPKSPPVNLLLGDTSGSIILDSPLEIFNVSSLRQDVTQCERAVA